MRYYDITAGSLHYTSLGTNGTNPEALNIECDISVTVGDSAAVGSWVRVWGSGLQDITACQGLFNQPFVMSGGMAAGLPLANPAQAGQLCQAKIFRAYGNWQMTDQNVEFILTSSGAAAPVGGPNPKAPINPIVLNWKKGQQLSGAIQTALQNAYPNFKVNVNIGNNYKAPSDQPGFHHGIPNFAQYIRRYTQMLAGPNSPGVSIVPSNGVINVFDGSSNSSGGTINYQDLVGQPTWLDVDKISIKVVMRGDLQINQIITLPRTIVTNTPGGGSQIAAGSAGNPQQSLSFQGTFQINALRHIGNFRQPDASAWVTVIEAITKSGSA